MSMYRGASSFMSSLIFMSLRYEITLFGVILCLTMMLLHGLQAVLKMLSEIGSVENIPEFLEGVKNRCLIF